MHTKTTRRLHPAGKPAESNRHGQAGFSMIEVLVSLMLIAITLLGQAGIQANALKLSKGAGLRMQAVFLSNELAERMESNKLGAVAGAYTVAMQSSTPITMGTNCATGACSSAALAAYDLSEWTTRVAATLRGSSWQITNPVAGNPSTYVIVVNWEDRRGNADTTTYEISGTTETLSLTSTKVIYQ